MLINKSPHKDSHEISNLIDELAASACSCDAILGYSCDTHWKIHQLKYILIKNGLLNGAR